MSIMWKYLDKKNGTIRALEDYSSMQFIIENTDSRIRQEHSRMTGLASPNMDGMPHTHNPQACEDRILNGIEEDGYQERTVTDEDLRGEYGYIVASKLLREMLDQGLITLDQYHKIDQQNRETFSPHLAGLMPSNR